MSSVALIEQQIEQVQSQDFATKRRAVRLRRLMHNLVVITLLAAGLILAGWSSSGLVSNW